MCDEQSIDEEVRENVRALMHPALATTQEIEKIVWDPPVFENNNKPIPGLSQRQMDLIYNREIDPSKIGVARERRLKILAKDIGAINRFLPRMEEVRSYLLTMPTNDDEELIEAVIVANQKLKSFAEDVQKKLTSLEQELEIKSVGT